jgi:hypothetical protein
MILAVEPTWTGTIHAPGNTTLLDIARMAFPKQQMSVFAEPRHLQEVQTLLNDCSAPPVQFHPIELGKAFLHKPHIVSARRLVREWKILRDALATVPPMQDCLLILLSASSTAIIAAYALARLRRGRTFIQTQLHGNLNEINAWRPRDPLRRALDLKSVLARNYHGRMRYLVLEEFIRAQLALVSPATAGVTDVLPHPLALKGHSQSQGSLQLPLRIGLVGLGSEDKGMGSFLRIARQLKQELGTQICFHHIGTFMPGTDMSHYSLLEEPPADKQLTREEFLARINRLHYFVFPYKKSYYGLSASGTFLDAVAALKPVIATRLALTEQFFREFGLIGYLCDGENDMISTIRGIALNPDAAAYQAQVDRLRTMRSSRLPEALAPTYRDIILKSLPGFDS